MARLRVQHCIVNRTTRQYGGHPTSDLLGVDYFHTLPADTEFPKHVEKIEVFVRFFCTDRVRGNIRITLTQIDEEGSDLHSIYDRLFPLPTIDLEGIFILDKSYKLLSLMIPAEGTYAVRVLRRMRREPWSQPEWRTLATEQLYFSRSI